MHEEVSVGLVQLKHMEREGTKVGQTRDRGHCMGMVTNSTKESGVRVLKIRVN